MSSLSIPKEAEKFKKMIIVEGDDDFRFLCHTLEEMNIHNIFIHNISGKQQLKSAIKTLKKAPFFNSYISLAIVIDADESFKSTEESIKSILLSENLTVPDEHGVKKSSNGILYTSYFIMPGKNKTGALEDLVIEFCKKKEVYKYVDTHVNDITTNESNIQTKDKEYKSPRNKKKSKVQIFLSSHDEPDSKIGLAVTKKIIDINDSVFLEIREYLKII